MDLLDNIKSIDDISPGHLPGYFFPKLIELGHLIIDPFSEDCLANICYYLHFNNKFRIPKAGTEPIKLLSKESIENAFEPYKETEKYVLEPNKSVIAQSYEYLGISEWLLSKLENTAALGRVFLNHASHGFIHPGHGIDKPFQLMIELTNFLEQPVELLPAHIKDKKIIGPDAFRLYIEKLPYRALEYKSRSSVPKLRMDSSDKS